MSSGDLLAVVCAFLIAFGSPFILRPLLARAGVVDVPNERSSHSNTVLRGGGLSQAIGMGVGLTIAAVAATGSDQGLLWIVLGAALASATLGWIEDVAGVAIAARAGLQFLIGLVATLVGTILVDESLWWALLGGLALLGLTNVVNFMDGINAISSLHGLVAGLSFVIIGDLHDTDWLIVSGAILAFAFLAFLPWNASGRIFLGDVGSYLLGGSIAIIVTLGWMTGLPIVALAAPMAIYVLDTGVTLVERARRGEKWYEAHREHTYQRIVQNGHPHLVVSAFVAMLSAASAGLGILAGEQEGPTKAAAICSIVGIALAYLAIRMRTSSTRLSKPRLDR